MKCVRCEELAEPSSQDSGSGEGGQPSTADNGTQGGEGEPQQKPTHPGDGTLSPFGYPFRNALNDPEPLDPIAAAEQPVEDEDEEFRETEDAL